MTTKLSRTSLRRLLASGATSLLLGALLLSGCGSSSSSSSGKAAYCSDFASLQASTKALTEVHVAQNGTTALKSAVTKVKDDARALADSAKGELSAQSSAITGAVNNLSESVKGLKNSPTTNQVTQIKTNVIGVQTAVKNFGASAKCG